MEGQSGVAKDDYRDDEGFLVCKTCGKPLQMRLPPVLGMERGLVVPVKCDCELAAEREEEERQAAQERAAKAAKMRRDCFEGFEKYRNWVFERDDGRNPTVSSACRRFTETFDVAEPYGLLLWGAVGTGKSVMSACMANALIDGGFSAKFTDMGSIVALMESSFEHRRANLDHILQYDMLFIEDLGAQRSTDYIMDHVYNVVDGRYRSGKPMVITTNFTLEEAAGGAPGKQWHRIFDRVMEVCYPIEFKGSSRRKRNAVDMRRIMSERLGI